MNPIPHLHYEKTKWFTTRLTIGFLNYNDHLQFGCSSTYFYAMNVIKQVEWVAMETINHMCNYIHIQLMQFCCNFTKTTYVQLQCKYYTTTITTSCWHYISSIHDDELCSFMSQLFYNYGCNENILWDGTTLPLNDN